MTLFIVFARGAVRTAAAATAAQGFAQAKDTRRPTDSHGDVLQKQLLKAKERAKKEKQRGGHTIDSRHSDFHSEHTLRSHALPFSPGLSFVPLSRIVRSVCRSVKRKRE